MKIKNHELPSGRDILYGAGLACLATAIVIPTGKELREALFPDTVAPIEQELPRQTHSDINRSYQDPELTAPNESKVSACRARVGSIAVHNHTTDLDLIRITALNSEGSKRGDATCAELYNPFSGRDLIDLKVGDNMWACKENDGNLEVSVAIKTTRKVVGTLDISPDFHSISGSDTIINCKDVDNWKFKPSESLSDASDFSVRNDIPYYNPDYDYLKKDDPVCYNKDTGMINWNNPNCFDN